MITQKDTMSKNPLSKLEEIINSNILSFKGSGLEFKVSKEATNKFTLPKEMSSDVTNEKPPSKDELEELDVNSHNDIVSTLRQVSIEAIQNIQNQTHTLNSEEIVPYINSILDSLSYLRSILEKSKDDYSGVKNALQFIESNVTDRYIKNSIFDNSSESDNRMRLSIDAAQIQIYFNRLIHIGVVSKEDLKLFLHSTFYGFDPKMEVKEKIEVKTTQANLRYFMYRFKEDNRLFEIDQKKFVDLLHNSFACFDGVEQATTYKKMSQKPAKFDLL